MMPNRRRRRCESTRPEGQALVAKQPSLGKQQRQQRGGLRIRLEGRRICGKRIGRVNFGSFIIAVMAGLAGWGTGGANAQFIDGGAIVMDCGVCSCDGSSDDGTIEVFDNPSSGERIAKVGGEYMGILETSCGTSVIAVGSTVYELSGVTLSSRTLEVLAMTTSDCTEVDAPATAACYSGSTSTLSLDDGVEMDVTFTLGMWTDGSTFYKSNVKVQVVGANSVEPEIEDFCLDYDFVSQLFSATVLGTTYVYNFEFAIPDEPVSADLAVAAAASASAGAFNCGEASPTPSPVMPVPIPTPPPPTPAPVAPDPEPPTPEPTTAPVPVLPPPPTPSPVLSTTIQPLAETVAPAAVTAPTGAPAAVETATPLATGTTSPVPVETTAPSVLASSTGTAAPSGTRRPTLAPSSGAPEPETLAPVDRGAPEPGTPAPVGSGALEEDACQLPEGDACTENTSVSFINSGVGSYYDLACDTELAAEGNLFGCDAGSSNMCRTCFFNTPLYIENNPGEEVPDYVDCPCCVLEVYDRDTAANEDGPRCENITPAPTSVTAEPSSATSANSSDQRSIEVLSFDDKGWKATSGEGVALAALGLFAALTFFPICSK